MGFNSGFKGLNNMSEPHWRWDIKVTTVTWPEFEWVGCDCWHGENRGPTIPQGRQSFFLLT